jgi:hypothetical protein
MLGRVAMLHLAAMVPSERRGSSGARAAAAVHPRVDHDGD